MDPFTLMMGAGLLMSAGGSLGSFFGQNEASEENKRQAGLEQQIQEQKRQQMILSSRRQQMEVIRNGQLQRSMALNSATAQGAQFGSGLAGGIGQVSGDTNTNLLGINQNLEIGQNIFGLNSQISDSKMRMSDIQTDIAMYQGLSSFGNSVMSASGKFGNIANNFFGGQSAGGNSGMSMNTYGGQIDSMRRGGIY